MTAGGRYGVTDLGPRAEDSLPCSLEAPASYSVPCAAPSKALRGHPSNRYTWTYLFLKYAAVIQIYIIFLKGALSKPEWVPVS